MITSWIIFVKICIVLEKIDCVILHLKKSNINNIVLIYLEFDSKKAFVLINWE